MNRAKAQNAPPRTYLRSSYHLDLGQEALQRNWSLYRRRRHREAGSRQRPAGAHLVEWTDAIDVVCGKCRKRLGRCVAFRSEPGFYGLVEDHPRWAAPLRMWLAPAGETAARPRWLWFEGDGPLALAHFRCGRCRQAFAPRNADRLAATAFEDQLRELVIS